MFAADIELDGDVVSRGAITLHGRIVGLVVTPEVIVASTGDLTGKTVARDLKGFGKVQGVIQGRKATLASTSVVLADVLHERIAIEAGAWFEGELSRRG